MSETKRPVNEHQAYHAHVYFDSKSQEIARRLCADVAENFALSVGRFHEKPVGPHPMGSCQVTFRSQDFDRFIPWLDAHREGLTIFVHGLTGDDLKDHTDYAYWLGQSVALNLGLFQVGIEDSEAG